MIQISPQTRILVAVESVDFRNGIDGLARVCKQHLQADPFSGGLFVFRNRRRTAIKIISYDGHGFWMCQKRLSMGRFRFWPASATERTQGVAAHQLQVLLRGGDPTSVKVPAAAPAVGAGVNNTVPPATERAYVPVEIRLGCRHGSEAALSAPGSHRQRPDLHPSAYY